MLIHKRAQGNDTKIIQIAKPHVLKDLCIYEVC